MDRRRKIMWIEWERKVVEELEAFIIIGVKGSEMGRLECRCG